MLLWLILATLLHHPRWVSLISKDELEHKDEYFRVGIFVILHESEYMFDDRGVAEYDRYLLNTGVEITE
jgi:hypothetical protein